MVGKAEDLQYTHFFSASSFCFLNVFLIFQVFCTALLLLWSPSFSWLLAVVFAGLYQMMLSHGGLTQSLLLGFHRDGQRHGFIDSNREGIVSCLGYVSIYWGGVFVGQLFFLPPR